MLAETKTVYCLEKNREELIDAIRCVSPVCCCFAERETVGGMSDSVCLQLLFHQNALKKHFSKRGMVGLSVVAF